MYKTRTQSVNDSQSTLVDSVPLSLTFDRNSVNDAIVSSPLGPLYTISTRTHLGITEVYACIAPGTRRLVARYEIRLFLPDVIHFPGKFSEKNVRMKRWLKTVKGKERAHLCNQGLTPVSSMESSDSRCLWSTSEGGQLSLFLEDEPYAPIATLQSASSWSPLTLEVDHQALTKLDEIIVSAVILEQRRRFEARLDNICIFY
ncbi:hypothetical protein HGRIS_009964 [Hohenbuehelia grisea]|uniref:DUF6593 domain-containing protein n=1 Tax=Hohenbuehelia grisea TaxID=104357 RepID=A0ABR3J2S0_9AGAR